MKAEKVTCIKASIDGATKDEKAAQVIEAAIELVRSMPDEAREGLAVALVTAGEGGILNYKLGSSFLFTIYY